MGAKIFDVDNFYNLGCCNIFPTDRVGEEFPFQMDSYDREFSVWDYRYVIKTSLSLSFKLILVKEEVDKYY